MLRCPSSSKSFGDEISLGVVSNTHIKARVKTLLLDDARILDAELDKLGPLGGLAVGDRGRVAEGSASTHFDFVVRLSEGVGDARRRLVTASEEWNCDDEPELDVPTKATWKIAEGKSVDRARRGSIPYSLYAKPTQPSHSPPQIAGRSYPSTRAGTNCQME